MRRKRKINTKPGVLGEHGVKPTEKKWKPF